MADKSPRHRETKKKPAKTSRADRKKARTDRQAARGQEASTKLPPQSDFPSQQQKHNRDH